MQKNSYFNIFLLGILWAMWVMWWVGDLYLALFLWALFSCLLVSLVLRHQKYKGASFFIFLGIFVWGSISYLHAVFITESQNIIEPYIWSYISQQGEVKELHKRSEYYDEYQMYLQQIWKQEIENKISYILRIPKNFSLDVWQQISYSWKLYPIEDFDGFAYKKFMLSKWIYFSTSASNFDTLDNPQIWWRYDFAYARENLLLRISSIFPEQEAIFLGGILFWARENIPNELKEDFNNSWLTHFIAVSGFNITLCIIFVTFLFGFLPVIWRIILVSLTIIGFSFFVWLWAPVVRAAIMGLIGYVFLQSWNTTKNITLLLFTALCMWIYSPLSLVYDVSLHLSFLAVIGIIYTQDILKKIFHWIPSMFAIREAFVLTLAALSFSLPVMIFQFWQVSLFAPFANIAVTWTIPLAMLWWAITILWDLIHPFIARILWFPTWILLHYDMLMVGFFWNLDFSLIRFDFWPYRNYLQALYFIFLVYLLSLYHVRHKKQP